MMKSLKKILTALIILTLLWTAPGIGAYQAAAQAVGRTIEPATAPRNTSVNTNPGFSSSLRSSLPNLTPRPAPVLEAEHNFIAIIPQGGNRPISVSPRAVMTTHPMITSPSRTIRAAVHAAVPKTQPASHSGLWGQFRDFVHTGLKPFQPTTTDISFHGLYDGYRNARASQDPVPAPREGSAKPAPTPDVSGAQPAATVNSPHPPAPPTSSQPSDSIPGPKLTGGTSFLSQFPQHLWMPEPIRVFKGHAGWVLSIVLDLAEKFLFTGSKDHTAREWNVDTAETVFEFKGHTGSVGKVLPSPDGKYLFTSGFDQIVILWDRKTKKEIRRFSGHNNWIKPMAVTSDGKYLFTAGNSTKIEMWETDTGKWVKEFAPDGDTTGYIWAMVLSPNNKYLYAGGGDDLARKWDLETGRVVMEFRGHTGSVSALALSPDEKHLYTGSVDTTGRKWDIETGKTVGEFKGHTSTVFSIIPSPDGKHLFTGSRDFTARMWDDNTGNLIQVVAVHDETVTSMALTQDIKYLFTGSVDKTVKMWEVPTDPKNSWLSHALLRLRAVGAAALVFLPLLAISYGATLLVGPQNLAGLAATIGVTSLVMPIFLMGSSAFQDARSGAAHRYNYRDYQDDQDIKHGSRMALASLPFIFFPHPLGVALYIALALNTSVTLIYDRGLSLGTLLVSMVGYTVAALVARFYGDSIPAFMAATITLITYIFVLPLLLGILIGFLLEDLFDKMPDLLRPYDRFSLPSQLRSQLQRVQPEEGWWLKHGAFAEWSEGLLSRRSRRVKAIREMTQAALRKGEILSRDLPVYIPMLKLLAEKDPYGEVRKAAKNLVEILKS
ncbi:MAG: hypothetical protein HY399_05205 [Elusimicrobia bacterium]|nr:hypothetical protein [Elusimicrobiota bacterium]